MVAVARAFAVGGRSAVKEAVLSGALPVRSAAVVIAEADRLAPVLAEGVEPTVVDGLIAMAVKHGPRGCGRGSWPSTAATVSCRPSRTRRSNYQTLIRVVSRINFGFPELDALAELGV